MAQRHPASIALRSTCNCSQEPNELLVKVCQGPQHKDPQVANNWSLQLRFCDASGKGLAAASSLPEPRRRHRMSGSIVGIDLAALATAKALLLHRSFAFSSAADRGVGQSGHVPRTGRAGGGRSATA